jgi:hypothetical protein
VKKRSLPAFTLVRKLESPSTAPVRVKAKAARFRGAKAAALPARRKASTKPTVVGILDLGSWMSGLPRLLVELNSAQKALRFYEVQAPIPAGMIKSDDRLVDWMQERRSRPLTAEERSDMRRNILFNEFAVAAEDIRVSSGIAADYLVGITPAMVAGGEGDDTFWNYFSAAQGRIIMVSTADMREFAKKAKRPFEVAIGGMMVATLLAQMTDGLEFHENRGCLFDVNAERSTIVNTLRKPRIEPACLEQMTPELQKAALAIVERLKTME